MTMNLTGKPTKQSSWRPSFTRLATGLMLTLLMVLTLSARAQIGGSGSINGAVTDQSGAIVPNATVVAKNTASGIVYTQKSSGSGTYLFSPLIPGDYTVTITASGFKTFLQEHISVDALAQVTVRSQLSVGATSETVTVSGAPPQLDTTDATTGFTMENEEYTELPLQINGSARNPTSFVYLTPGVAHGGVAVQTGIFNGTGSQGRVDEVYIDGFPQTSIYEQGDPRYVSSAISVEAVDQFQVVTGNQGAQYQGIGLENYVIKSGTNTIHGSVFEYMRTTALDTWGFFAPSTINPTTGTAVKPNEHQSEYGVDLGGPIKKDRIFYFGNYDGYYYHKDNNPTYTTYPTLLMQKGNFSQLLPAGTTYNQCVYNAVSNPTPPAGCLYDPTTCPTGTQASGTCVRTPYNYGGVLNQINPALEGSAEQFMTKFLPTPINNNLVNNYLSQIPSFSSHWANTNRLDWKVNDKQAVAFVFAVSRGAPYGYGSNGSNPGPLPYTSGQGYETKNKIFLLEHTYNLTSKLINQVKYSYTRLWAPVYNPDYRTAGFGIGTNGGVTGLPAGQASASFPTVTFSGGSSTVGTVANTQWSGDQDYNSMTNYFTLLDNMQYVRGNHSLTYGFTKEWLELNEFQYSTGTQPLQLAYSNAQNALYVPTISAATGLPTGSVQSTNTGNSFASLFVGNVNNASFTQLPFVDTGARMRNLSLYLQDDWRVTSKINVNLGLRWDYFPPYEEAQNRSTWFTPTVNNPLTGNPGALQFAGRGAQGTYCNCNTPIQTWYKNFGPRLGIAYSIKPTTVLRAGFAMTYSHGTGVRNATYLGTGVSGIAAAPSFVATTGGDAAFNLNNGIPAYQTPPIINAGYGTYYTSQPHGAAVGMAYPDPYLGDRAPYANNYVVGIDQQITKNLAMQVNYVGSQGHFLPVASGGARGYYNNALNPIHYNLGTLLGQIYSPATLAAAQAIDPSVALPYPTFSGGTIAQMLTPFPQYSGVGDTYDNIVNSAYNAGQIILKERMSNGLQFYFNYSFSEEEDDGGTYRDGYLSNRVERSRGIIDEPSILNATGIYQLPFGDGHRFGSGNAIERKLTGGWLVSGIYTYNSGVPLAIIATGCTTPNEGQCMPNYNRSYGGPVRINGSYGRGQTATHLVNYLSPQAFALPPIYTFGNVQRTAPLGLRGPTAYDLDMSVKKNIKITERYNAVFDISAYNVTNVTIFSGPSVTYTPGTTTFGQVASQSNASRDIQLALRINF